MTYTVTISNIGKAPAWDVKVIDTYPVSTTFKAAQPPPDVGDNEWHLGDLLPDQTRSISTTLLVDSKVVSGTVLINTVTAQSEWTAPVVVTDTVVVHERCIPLASATLDGPGTVEVGQSGVFKVNYTPGNATSPISYAWSADGLTGGGGTSTATYRWTASGAKTIKVQASNCGDGGKVEAERKVTVYVPCEPPHDASFQWQPEKPSVNELVRFAAVSQGTAPLNYDWLFADGTHDTGQDIYHKFATAGSHLVTSTVQNRCGETSVTRTVTVAQTGTPPSGLDFKWMPPEPKVKEDVIFTAAIMQGDEPITYGWEFGDGTVMTGKQVTHPYKIRVPTV